MRARSIASLVLLLLPAVLAGQSGRVRRPPTGGRPPGPAPKPPQAPGIHDARLFYNSSRFSFESYALMSFVHTDRYVTDSAASTWSMQGVGFRIDWRFTPTFSLTGDATSAMLGGPFGMLTVDVGGRYRPEREGQKIQPYLDARTSWAHTYDTYAQPYGMGILAGPPQSTWYEGRTTSNGFGGLIGAGFETGLTRSFALTTGMSLSRYYMSSIRVGAAQLGSDFNYQATAARFTIGVKYNQHRVARPNP